MFVGSCTLGIICKYENRMPKVARNVFNIGEVWNPVCCHSNKTVKLKLWSTFSRIYCKESNISDTNWLRYPFSPYLIKIWLRVWHHHLANLHIIKLLFTIFKYLFLFQRYLKIVNSIFLLMQATCLRFKMA